MTYIVTHCHTYTQAHGYTHRHMVTHTGTWLHTEAHGYTQRHMVTHLCHISHWSKGATSPAPYNSVTNINSDVLRIPHVPQSILLIITVVKATTPGT